MKESTAQLIKGLIENVRGDNYYRAKVAFRDCTPEQMDDQYGESGKTRRQLLEEYRMYEEIIDRAREEFDQLLMEKDL